MDWLTIFDDMRTAMRHAMQALHANRIAILYLYLSVTTGGDLTNRRELGKTH